MIRRLLRWVGDIVRFLFERPARLAVLVAVFAAGALAGYPPSDAAFDYMWKDPRSCATCHVHDYANEAYFRSVHAGVTTCHDCHKVPLTHLMAEGLLMVTDRPETPTDMSRTSLKSVVCQACHFEGDHEELTGPLSDELRTRIVKINESPLHKLHLESETRKPGAYLGGAHGGEGGDEAHSEPTPFAPEIGGGHGDEAPVDRIVCLDCHGSGGKLAAHRFSADRQNCLECHGGIDVAVGRLTELRCQECHFSGFVGVRPGDTQQPAVE